MSTISVFRRISRAKRLCGGRLDDVVFDSWSASPDTGATAASCSSEALGVGTPFLDTGRVLSPETRLRSRESVDAEAVRELVPILGLASGMNVFSRLRPSNCLASDLLPGVDESPEVVVSFTLSLLWEGLVLGKLRIETEVLCLVRPTGRGTRLTLVELVGVGVLLSLAMFSPVSGGGVLLRLARGDTDFEEGILSLGIPVSCLCKRLLAEVS